MFVFLSNYFNVLSPQVTGFIIDHVQQSLNLLGYKTPAKQPNYDMLVNKFTGWVQGQDFTIGKIVALCGITILLLALLGH